MGFNPMMQFIHESDVVQAVLLTLGSELSGVYNLAGEGAVPWKSAIELAGSRSLPLPHLLAYPATRLASRLDAAFPDHLMDFFRYPVIVSDQAFRADFGFAPRVSVLDTLRSVDDITHDAVEVRPTN